MTDARAVWDACAAAVRIEVSEAVWQTTFNLVNPLDFNGRRLSLGVPNTLVKERFEGRFRSLVVDALEMAAGLRRPPGGLVAHTDAGSQYTSITYTERIAELGMEPSIGSVGDALDNAMAEAWVGTIKSELIQGRIMGGFEHTEHEILGWISWYNRERLHEELGYRPPAEFEAINNGKTPRPCGPPEAVQPAFLGALADLGRSTESL